MDCVGQRGDPTLTPAIGIFGGTFDPVHIGHLRTALELREHLGLSEMRLMPCGDPPHKEIPHTPAADRLAMVRLAIEDEPGLQVDDREIKRGGLSYTVETLTEVRAQVGQNVPVCLCIGMDSLVQLNSWHRWHELTDYCHIVVAARPGWRVPTTGEIGGWLTRCQINDSAELLHQPAGGVYLAEMRLLPVSATDIREALATGHSIRYLTPDRVINYIEQQGLYSQGLN